MKQEILISILALAGTLVGTFGGIITSAKLSNYRIEQLEKKVEKLNGLYERMTAVENCTKNAQKRIDKLLEGRENEK